MGEVAVLQPQNFLKNRLPREALIYERMKTRRNLSSTSKPYPKANPNPNNTKSNRGKRSPPRLHEKNLKDGGCPRKNLVMGQVKILKRGQELQEATPSTVDEEVGGLDDLVLSSADRLGPEPEIVTNQLKLSDLYAGSAFVVSPPPSSLPLPVFLTRKSVLETTSDSTLALVRMLRLDLG